MFSSFAFFSFYCGSEICRLKKLNGRLPVVQPYLRYMPGFCSQNSHNICCGAHAACRSVLFVRNVNHWSTDETWQIFLPEGEEIEVGS